MNITPSISNTSVVFSCPRPFFLYFTPSYALSYLAYRVIIGSLMGLLRYPTFIYNIHSLPRSIFLFILFTTSTAHNPRLRIVLSATPKKCHAPSHINFKLSCDPVLLCLSLRLLACLYSAVLCLLLSPNTTRPLEKRKTLKGPGKVRKEGKISHGCVVSLGRQRGGRGGRWAKGWVEEKCINARDLGYDE